MRNRPQPGIDRQRTQFGLLAIMEWAAISAILFAFAKVIGVASSMLLAMMAFTLMARWGLLTILLMAAAMISVDESLAPRLYGDYDHVLCVVLLVVAICVWYRLRNDTVSRFRG